MYSASIYLKCRGAFTKLAKSQQRKPVTNEQRGEHGR